MRALGIIIVTNSNLGLAVWRQEDYVGEETGLKPKEAMPTIPLILLQPNQL